MQNYKNSEISVKINEHIHSKRDRHILKLRLIDGLTYEQIAETVGLSPRYTRALCTELIKTLEIA